MAVTTCHMTPAQEAYLRATVGSLSMLTSLGLSLLFYPENLSMWELSELESIFQEVL